MPVWKGVVCQVYEGKALDACLKPEHRKAGYYLDDDEEFLYLKRENDLLAVWSIRKATVEMVRAEVDRLMSEGGITEERTRVRQEFVRRLAGVIAEARKELTDGEIRVCIFTACSEIGLGGEG